VKTGEKNNGTIAFRFRQVLLYYITFTLNFVCDSNISKKGATCFTGRAAFLELVVIVLTIFLYNCLWIPFGVLQRVAMF